MLQQFIMTFVPLFIVIDAIGVIPFLVSIEHEIPSGRLKMINTAIITATAVGLVFLFFGQFILEIMNISVGSFAIAGGLILLIFSINYMTTGHLVDATKEDMVAVVPIGTPLTAGPATITTLLLLATQFPLWIVLVSYALNMVVAWGIFLLGNRISRFLGQGGLRAFSRVFSLLLTAIAVSMIINGLTMLKIII
jgi:multiple antibiotic resistance protein